MADIRLKRIKSADAKEIVTKSVCIGRSKVKVIL